MSLSAWNASDRTLRDAKPSKSKSPRFWKFINTLVPKMVESDSEDEEDDPVGLEQVAPPGGTHPGEQEEHLDVASILSGLAFGPSSRDGAKGAFQVVTENRDETIDETMKEGEAVGPQMLADQRSQQPKATTQQRGASVREHNVKEAASSRDDGSDLRSAVYSAQASRSSRCGSSAKTDLPVQAYQEVKNDGDQQAGKIALRSSADVVVNDNHIAAKSLADQGSADLVSAAIGDPSVPADSICEENTLHSAVSPPVLDAAPTKDQPLDPQLLEESPALRDTEIDPPEAVTSDGSSKHPLGSNFIGGVSLGSQPSLRDFERALHNCRKISSSKFGEVGTANREHIPIIWNMRLPIGAVVSKSSSRLTPTIIEQLLNNVSLVPWQRKAISSGRNPFIRTGNLGHVRPELQEVWTTYGTATILRINLCSDLGSGKDFPNVSCSAFHTTLGKENISTCMILRNNADSGLQVGSSDTKKNSLLLELPLELRENIYFHVFQLQDKHQSHAKSHKQGHIETALLRTCRSIYFEARCMPLQVNEFQFERSLYAEFFIDRLSAPQQRCLRSLLVRAGTTDCYLNGLGMWRNLFNALFGLYARGTRLRTLTVVFEGPWDIEIESKIEAIWSPLENALHFIEDFYLSIEDAEVSHEVKAGLHSKWATFLTGHAKEWPPLGTAHTSPVSTTFVLAPISDVDGLDSSNISSAHDPSDTNDDLDEPDASTEAAAQTSHNHTAITDDGSANHLTPGHRNIIDANADAVAGNFDSDELQSNFSNIGTSRITDIIDDEQPQHPVRSQSPYHDPSLPPEDPPKEPRPTITQSENKTSTASSPAHLKQHAQSTT
ncbi:MAG: hypothetical protein LQ347_006415, partial [Umbilicaria vellea]